MKNKVACVLLINKNKEILLFLRDNKPTIPYPNTWALIGGHLEAGETPVEALKRETKEEIDYKIENMEFIGMINDRAGSLVYIYKSEINKRADELHLAEGQKLGFFSIEDSMKLDIPFPLREFLIKNKNRILEDS